LWIWQVLENQIEDMVSPPPGLKLKCGLLQFSYRRITLNDLVRRQGLSLSLRLAEIKTGKYHFTQISILPRK